MSSNRWIRGPLTDLGWVILCPALALGALHLVWGSAALSDRAVYALMLAFIVTGHHLPGWLRAFGEPEIYRRYGARLWTSFIAVPLLVMGFALAHVGVVGVAIATTYDLWHVSAQQHGVGRIYAAKAGDLERGSARLDVWCVVTWYVTAVFWSDSWMGGLARAVRLTGWPVFDAVTPGLWHDVQVAALVFSGVLLFAYVTSSVRIWRRTGQVAWLKHAAHAVALTVVGYSYQDPNWFRAQSAQSVFHAVQYFFLVWVFAHGALRQRPFAHRGFYRYLFGDGSAISRYALVIGLYGVGGYILANWQFGLHSGALTSADIPLTAAGWSAEHGIEVLGAIGLTSVLLHYYADAFIWKVRSRPVRETLEVAGEAGLRPDGPESVRRGVAHALLYFGVAALVFLVGALQTRTPDATYASVRHEAELFPRSASAHDLFARAALERGDRATAEPALKRALALSSTVRDPARLLRGFARERGDTEAALRYARMAVRAVPEEASRRVELAIALYEVGRRAESERVMGDRAAALALERYAEQHPEDATAAELRTGGR